MTPLYKLRKIEELVINFDGNPGKLEPIARQLDLLGSMIEKDSKVYKKLASARKIITNPKRIDKVLEYLSDAETLLIYGE